MTQKEWEKFKELRDRFFAAYILNIGFRFFAALRRASYRDRVELERKLTERQQAEIESQLWSA